MIESAPYRFLMGHIDEYKTYCETRRRDDYMDLSELEYKKEAQKNCVNHYLELIRDLKKETYDGRRLIVVNRENMVMDGLHRACCLLYHFGPGFPVRVLRIHDMWFDEVKTYGKKFLRKNLSAEKYQEIKNIFKAL